MLGCSVLESLLVASRSGMGAFAAAARGVRKLLRAAECNMTGRSRLQCKGFWPKASGMGTVIDALAGSGPHPMPHSLLPFLHSQAPPPSLPRSWLWPLPSPPHNLPLLPILAYWPLPQSWHWSLQHATHFAPPSLSRPQAPRLPLRRSWRSCASPLLPLMCAPPPCTR